MDRIPMIVHYTLFLNTLKQVLHFSTVAKTSSSADQPRHSSSSRPPAPGAAAHSIVQWAHASSAVMLLSLGTCGTMRPSAPVYPCAARPLDASAPAQASSLQIDSLNLDFPHWTQ